jgi:hypothetical protein
MAHRLELAATTVVEARFFDGKRVDPDGEFARDAPEDALGIYRHRRHPIVGLVA